MAGVPDDRLVSVGPWPLGVNNLAKEGRLPTGENGHPVALREADNIDIDRDGFVTRRQGTSRFHAGTLVHSLWAHADLPFGLFVDDGILNAVLPDGRVEDVDADPVGGAPVSYDLIGERAYYASVFASGMIGADMVPRAWAPEHPGGQPHLASTTGTLTAGQYQVAVTFMDDLGRESGSTGAVAIDLADGQGIALSSIPPANEPSTVRVNIYLTGPNDNVLRLYGSLAPNVATITLVSAANGRALQTQFLAALPPGQLTCGHNGRQFVATGRNLRWSEPLRYGMARSTSLMRFNAPIDLMEPVGRGTEGAGLYVAAGSRTYWHGGTDPGNWNQVIASGHGVVPGTACRVTADVLGFDGKFPVSVWLNRGGQFCVGMPGGQVVPLKRGEFVANDADRGAALFRQGAGLQQIITSLRGARHNNLAITDSVVAHIIYDGSVP